MSTTSGALAHDPPLLRATWERLANVMAPGALDPLVKELIYVAVSVANGCAYCIHSHTAAARAKGMTAAQHAELLAVIAMASQTNALATALQGADRRPLFRGLNGFDPALRRITPFSLSGAHGRGRNDGPRPRDRFHAR